MRFLHVTNNEGTLLSINPAHITLMRNSFAQIAGGRRVVGTAIELIDSERTVYVVETVEEIETELATEGF